MRGHVILSHGSESGPDATKVTVLAAVAEGLGYSSERPDYRGIDDPLARRDLLLARCRAARAPLVLVGSSLGSWISGLASLQAPVAALFLLVPPLALGDGTPAFDCARVRTEIVHAWGDELIPARDVIDFCAARDLTLHLVDDTHRLSNNVERIAGWFGDFLKSLA